jgi:hypothetical protein
VADAGAVWISGGVKVESGGTNVDYGGVVGSVCFGGGLEWDLRVF